MSQRRGWNKGKRSQGKTDSINKSKKAQEEAKAEAPNDATTPKRASLAECLRTLVAAFSNVDVLLTPETDPFGALRDHIHRLHRMFMSVATSQRRRRNQADELVKDVANAVSDLLLFVANHQYPAPARAIAASLCYTIVKSDRSNVDHDYEDDEDEEEDDLDAVRRMMTQVYVRIHRQVKKPLDELVHFCLTFAKDRDDSTLLFHSVRLLGAFAELEFDTALEADWDRNLWGEFHIRKLLQSILHSRKHLQSCITDTMCAEDVIPSGNSSQVSRNKATTGRGGKLTRNQRRRNRQRNKVPIGQQQPQQQQQSESKSTTVQDMFDTLANKLRLLRGFLLVDACVLFVQEELPRDLSLKNVVQRIVTDFTKPYAQQCRHLAVQCLCDTISDDMRPPQSWTDAVVDMAIQGDHRDWAVAFQYFSSFLLDVSHEYVAHVRSAVTHLTVKFHKHFLALHEQEKTKDKPPPKASKEQDEKKEEEKKHKDEDKEAAPMPLHPVEETRSFFVFWLRFFGRVEEDPEEDSFMLLRSLCPRNKTKVRATLKKYDTKLPPPCSTVFDVVARCCHLAGSFRFYQHNPLVLRSLFEGIINPRFVVNERQAREARVFNVPPKPDPDLGCDDKNEHDLVDGVAVAVIEIMNEAVKDVPEIYCNILRQQICEPADKTGLDDIAVADAYRWISIMSLERIDIQEHSIFFSAPNEDDADDFDRQIVTKVASPQLPSNHILRTMLLEVAQSMAHKRMSFSAHLLLTVSRISSSQDLNAATVSPNVVRNWMFPHDDDDDDEDEENQQGQDHQEEENGQQRGTENTDESKATNVYTFMKRMCQHDNFSSSELLEEITNMLMETDRGIGLSDEASLDVAHTLWCRGFQYDPLLVSDALVFFLTRCADFCDLDHLSLMVALTERYLAVMCPLVREAGGKAQDFVAHHHQQQSSSNDVKVENKEEETQLSDAPTEEIKVVVTPFSVRVCHNFLGVCVQCGMATLNAARSRLDPGPVDPNSRYMQLKQRLVACLLHVISFEFPPAQHFMSAQRHYIQVNVPVVPKETFHFRGYDWTPGHEYPVISDARVSPSPIITPLVGQRTPHAYYCMWSHACTWDLIQTDLIDIHDVFKVLRTGIVESLAGIVQVQSSDMLTSMLNKHWEAIRRSFKQSFYQNEIQHWSDFVTKATPDNLMGILDDIDDLSAATMRTKPLKGAVLLHTILDLLEENEHHLMNDDHNNPPSELILRVINTEYVLEELVRLMDPIKSAAITFEDEAFADLHLDESRLVVDDIQDTLSAMYEVMTVVFNANIHTHDVRYVELLRSLMDCTSFYYKRLQLQHRRQLRVNGAPRPNEQSPHDDPFQAWFSGDNVRTMLWCLRVLFSSLDPEHTAADVPFSLDVVRLVYEVSRHQWFVKAIFMFSSDIDWAHEDDDDEEDVIGPTYLSSIPKMLLQRSLVSAAEEKEQKDADKHREHKEEEKKEPPIPLWREICTTWDKSTSELPDDNDEDFQSYFTGDLCLNPKLVNSVFGFPMDCLVPHDTSSIVEMAARYNPDVMITLLKEMPTPAPLVVVTLYTCMNSGYAKSFRRLVDFVDPNDTYSMVQLAFSQVLHSHLNPESTRSRAAALLMRLTNLEVPQDAFTDDHVDIFRALGEIGVGMPEAKYQAIIPAACLLAMEEGHKLRAFHFCRGLYPTGDTPTTVLARFADDILFDHALIGLIFDACHGSQHSVS